MKEILRWLVLRSQYRSRDVARIALARGIAILCISMPLSVSAQGGNPYDGDRTAIRAGSALYRARCADCHGPDALGDMGPNLTTLWDFGTDNDVRAFETIQLGVPGSVMPSTSLPENKIWAMVAYLESLSTVPPWVDDSGDSVRGSEIFSSECASCHKVNGQGGLLGPDLSRIAQVRSRDAVMRAIRDPSGSVASGYRAVTLMTRDGGRIRGLIKNEDAFSIQIMDTAERLQAYLKAELRETVREELSEMPEFGPDRLSDPDLDDLLGYIGTLKEPDPDGL